MRTLIIPFVFILTLTSCAQSFQKEIKQHRSEYKADFLKEERSPFYNKKEDLKYLRFYKPNKKYQVKADFKRTPKAESFDMATYSGQTRKYVKYGMLTFKIKGQDLKLAVYQNLTLAKMPQYKDHLFIPFKDFTNGESTYGGGRYIDINTTDIVDGVLLLDFNKCYNPYCAFSDGYSCPIPPKENHLDFAIKAGEKAFGKGH